ncbi:hypothetical protein JCM17844_19220 [Iodidimonas gelatinilytica]|uniref:Copper resistance protein B n=1 Tax=Iodidimonas gelatinilytica TaxID=1236966 RepID=A0A5A7MTG8_9PROT|nr:copper resistance protein B [Iodidimonas gelatinilytica]GEQ98285.1 hypothetical protein JCM17844_19220 [Iodidimonas gelatinilytica]
MRALYSVVFICLSTFPASAQDARQTGAPADWPLPIHDTPATLFLQADRVEYRVMDGDDAFLWDMQGWFGSDRHKFWTKMEGEGTIEDGVDDAEFQALYSRMITPFFDLQMGVRQDVGPGPSRSYAVLGLQGLMPYWFELDGALFLSDKGDLTARVETEYELMLTQRLVAQPRIELNFAAQDIEESGIGAGLSSAEVGLRLRYEVRRQFAPYIGISWERLVGDSADFARARGSDPGETSVVFGLRFWF